MAQTSQTMSRKEIKGRTRENVMEKLRILQNNKRIIVTYDFLGNSMHDNNILQFQPDKALTCHSAVFL